ncbi:unnamed protein product, partial [Polarella glacialis]
DKRGQELAAKQKRLAAGSSAESTPVAVGAGHLYDTALGSTAIVAAGGLAAAGARKAAAENLDAVSLRASLADPSGPRMHAPGEVAEHFRRLSEMKRRFRRAEFGGPSRKRSPSRSRSREKYNSVWIRPGASGSSR